MNEPAGSDLRAILIAVAIYVVALYASIVLHELGHAVAGWAAGYEITSFGTGLGRPLWVGRIGSTRAFICLISPVQGLTFAVHRSLLAEPWQFACFTLGGVTANALVALAAVIGLCLFGAPGLQNIADSTLFIVAVLNTLFVVVNLIPFSVRIRGTSIRNDGLQTLLTIRGRGSESPTPATIGKVAMFRPLWQAIGDNRALHLGFVAAARAWSRLGDHARAHELMDEAKAIGISPASTAWAYAQLIRSEIERNRGNPAEAGTFLDKAAAAFERLNPDTGKVLVSIAKANATADLLTRREALDRLADHPIVRSRASLRAGVLVDRIQAHAREPESPVLQTLTAEYDGLRKLQPSASRDIQVFTAFAMAAEQRAGLPGAGDWYEQAVRAADDLYGLFTEADDRRRFAAIQQTFVAAASGCFRKLGRDKNADAAEDIFSAVHEARIKGALKRKTDLTWVINGLVLLVFNLALSAFICELLGEMLGRGESLADYSVDELLFIGMSIAAIGCTGLQLPAIAFFVRQRIRSAEPARVGFWVLILGLTPAGLGFLRQGLRFGLQWLGWIEW